MNTSVPMTASHEKWEFLHRLAAKYIWWKTPEEALRHPARVIAQVMDLGEFRDVAELSAAVGEDVLRQTLQQAQAGWFSPRSWHFWHYRLRLCGAGQVPPLPQRTFS